MWVRAQSTEVSSMEGSYHGSCGTGVRRRSGQAGERLLGAHASGGGFAVREEAPEQHHLADADHQQDDGLANGPEGHPGVKVLGTAAALRLPQTEMGLIVDH